MFSVLDAVLLLVLSWKFLRVHLIFLFVICDCVQTHVITWVYFWGTYTRFVSIGVDDGFVKVVGKDWHYYYQPLINGCLHVLSATCTNWMTELLVCISYSRITMSGSLDHKLILSCKSNNTQSSDSMSCDKQRAWWEVSRGFWDLGLLFVEVNFDL